MANLTYTEEVPEDGGTKKIWAALADNGGNEFEAVAGDNSRLQNGERVCDLSVKVTTTGGAGATIGEADDAKVDTDAPGTISSKLRGAVSRLAELVVAFVDLLTRIPAALGQTDKDNSFPVVLASDQNLGFLLQHRQTFGAVYGKSTDAAPYAGDTSDWWAIRQSTEAVVISDALNTQANCLKYFQANHASMNTTPVWVFIPIGGYYLSSDWQAGYKDFFVRVTNKLGVSIDVTLYGIGMKDQPSTAYLDLGLFDLDALPIDSGIDFFQIDTDTILDNGAATFGPAGGTMTDRTQWPMGILVIKMAPAGDPSTSDYWSLAVHRSS